MILADSQLEARQRLAFIWICGIPNLPSKPQNAALVSEPANTALHIGQAMPKSRQLALDIPGTRRQKLLFDTNLV